MGYYGVAYFGLDKYGRDPNLARSDFSVQPFNNTASGYGTQILTWKTPLSAQCTKLRLLRSFNNLPLDEIDGIPVNGFDVSGNFVDYPVGTTSVIDRGVAAAPTVAVPNPVPNGLPVGFVYYTMFGWDSANLVWVRSGDLVALTPINWNYGYQLYNRLPAMYHVRDWMMIDQNQINPINPNDGAVTAPLQKFVNMLGYQLDTVRTEIESLMMVNDPIHCSGALLPLLAYEFGVPWEPEIGMKQVRKFIQNAVHLYKLKGCSQGLTEFVSTFTGWPINSVYLGQNKLLCQDDSVFLVTLGTWRAYPPPDYYLGTTPTGNLGVTVAGRANFTQGSLVFAQTLAVPQFNALLALVGLTPQGYVSSGMSITAPGSAGPFTTTVCTGYIPMIDFLSTSGTGNITWQLYYLSPNANPAHGVTLTLRDEKNNVIATNTFTTVPGTWTKFVLTVPLSNPVGKYVLPCLTVTSVVNSEVDYVSFAGLYNVVPGSINPVYDYPRDIKVIIEPDSANLFSNPLRTFKVSTDAWISYNTSTPTVFTGTSPTVLQGILQAEPDWMVGYYAPTQVPTAIGSMVVQILTGGGVAGIVGAMVPTVNVQALPKGWFNAPASPDWFPGSSFQFSATRPWMSQSLGWFFESGSYFGIGGAAAAGDWGYLEPRTSSQPLMQFTPLPNTWYVFSIYARAAAQAALTDSAIQLAIVWILANGTVQIGSGLAGGFFPNPVNITLTQQFQRISVADQTPPNAVGMAAAILFPNGAVGDTYYFSCAQMEPSATPSSPSPFFDSDMFIGNSDYFPDLQGSTYHYRRFTAKSTRLRALLPDWIPAGATVSTIYSYEKV